MHTRTRWSIVRSSTRRLLVAATLLHWSTAGAQPIYESVFESSASSRQGDGPTDWYQANRTAGDLGGFVGQMRAAARRSPAPAASGESAGAKPETIRGMPELLSTLRSAGSGAHR